MASLYISEYAGIYDVNHKERVPRPAEPVVASQKVTFTTSTASSAFNAGTKLVRVVADAACHILVGADPTATTSHMPLAADEPYFFQPLGPGLKIAAVVQA